MSEVEEQFDFQCRAYGLPVPEREYRFNKVRKWRFDFAWPESKIAAEIEGGTWAGGRHTRGSGFERDCEKYNTAALQGWRVFRFTSGMVASGEAVATIHAALQECTERGKIYAMDGLIMENDGPGAATVYYHGDPIGTVRQLPGLAHGPREWRAYNLRGEYVGKAYSGKQAAKLLEGVNE